MNAEIQVGMFTNRAFTVTMGKKDIDTHGASVVRKVPVGVENDDFMYRDGFEAAGALTIEGALMTAGAGRVVVIEPSVSLVGRVELAPNKVGFTIGVGLESAKFQNK